MRQSALRLMVALPILGLAYPGSENKSAATGSSERPGICNPEAQNAYSAGQMERARQGFLAALAEAEKVNARGRVGACAFYLGLIAQTEARTAADAGLGRERLGDAAHWYEIARSDERDAPGLIANLAMVYSDLGDRRRAEKLFEAELPKMSGDARPALARSYARFLGPQQWARAADLYSTVLERVPDDDESREALFSLLGKHAPARLPGAVWDAVEAGRILAAQRAAIGGLSMQKLPGNTSVGLLAGLVASLSLQHYDAKSFATEGVGLALAHLEGDHSIGAGARQVLTAHASVTFDAGSFDWWDKAQRPYWRSPLFAFRSLLRSLAARVERGDPRVARNYLEAADQLGSKTPDARLWIELAHNYLATHDFEKLAKSRKRWDSVLERTSDQVPGPELIAYRRTMNECLQGPEDERCLQFPKDGGAGPGHWAFSADGHCVFGMGGCGWAVRLNLTVPSPAAPRYRGEEGLTQTAVIEVGCRGRHVLEMGPPRRNHVRTDAVDFAASRRELAGKLYPRPADASLGPQMRDGFHRVVLHPQPAWLSSAIWLRDSDLLLADSLRRQLLRYREDGVLEEVVPSVIPKGEGGYIRVQSSPSGRVVAEDAFGHLGSNLTGSGRQVEFKLVGRRTAAGTLMSVFQWILVSEREALAVANILRSDGVWTSAIVRLPVAGDRFEVIHPIGLQEPSSDLYRVGIPALAGVGGVSYFLAMEEDPIGLYEVRPGALPRRLTAFRSPTRELRQELARRMSLERTADLFRLLEAESLPAGIFGHGGRLYLLARTVDKRLSTYVWSLSQLDPRDGRVLHAVTLPTMAPHLTASPGNRRWAFFEKGAVEGPGRQPVPSMLLVPTELLTGSSHGKRLWSFLSASWNSLIYPPIL
jgi:tetratricopeptide (TPR) repeat protein